MAKHRKPKQDAAFLGVTAEIKPPPPGAYLAAHLELRLTTKQRIGYRAAFDALMGQQLENGRAVATQPDAVRWLFEQFARDAIDADMAGQI